MRDIVTGAKAERYFKRSTEHSTKPSASKACANTLVTSAFVTAIGIRDLAKNYRYAPYTGSRSGPDEKMMGIDTECTQTGEDFTCILGFGIYPDPKEGAALAAAFEQQPDVLAVRKCLAR